MSVSAASVNPSPRSVNVALETSFLFEPKDINDNISFIKNIKVFLDKLYNILAPQARDIQQFRTEPARKFSFVDFIKNVGDSFMNFTDGKLQKTIRSLDVQVGKMANKSKSTIKDILPNKSIKEYLQESVKQWAQMDAELLRHKLNKLMNENNPLLQNFGKRMNDYYNEEDVKKLNKYLTKLSNMEPNMSPSKLIKDALHFGILEKYKNLNYTSRVNLVNDMKLLADFVLENNKFKFKMEESNKAPVIMKRNFAEPEISVSDTDNAIGDLKDSIEKDEMYNELKKTIGRKLKIASEIKLASDKLNDDKKGAATNEIVVDNVELILQSAKNP